MGHTFPLFSYTTAINGIRRFFVLFRGKVATICCLAMPATLIHISLQLVWKQDTQARHSADALADDRFHFAVQTFVFVDFSTKSGSSILMMMHHIYCN